MICGTSWLVSSRYSSKLPPNNLGWPPPCLGVFPIRLLKKFREIELEIRVREIQEFSVTQILREINLGEF